MSFPAKDNLCTRFATEVVLRKCDTIGTKITIIPGSNRSDDEKKQLADFTCSTEGLDIGRVVDAAKVAMGLADGGKVFSTDVLRVEISGPDQPHLTMVDLPGLFVAGNKDQSTQDAEVVDALVMSYMENPRTIILACVSAKSDFALQQVTQRARAVDPKGLRTLGLITKPDTLDAGSDSEGSYLALAENKDVKFRLGWHVVRNRDYKQRNISTAERDQMEASFFSRGIWAALPPSQVGIAALRARLIKVLTDHLMKHLPVVLDDIEKGIVDCERIIANLGLTRQTTAEQRRYLLHASNNYCALIRAAVDGMYGDMFFAITDNEDYTPRRLRAAVQNSLSKFAEDMRLRGHYSFIAEEDDKENNVYPKQIRRDEYLKQVKDLMQRSRGRELPGTFNPLIISELFIKQCKPWKGLIDALVKSILDDANTTVQAAITHVTDPQTADALLRTVVAPGIAVLGSALAEKVTEILQSCISAHPITYNNYLIETVQRMQRARSQRVIETCLETHFNHVSFGKNVFKETLSLGSLAKQLLSSTEPDMEHFAGSLATDMMQAYYTVALKRIVDDVSVLAIESCLLSKLEGLLSLDIICDLDDYMVRHIAGESDEVTMERARAAEKLHVLEAGAAELKALQRKPMSST
ncbi:hypothetical protein MCOR25_003179 [Pyricularia grisea]|nr:hypothetical protein MCOR25_003179 [Pyricularia grisea]